MHMNDDIPMDMDILRLKLECYLLFIYIYNMYSWVEFGGIDHIRPILQ